MTHCPIYILKWVLSFRVDLPGPESALPLYDTRQHFLQWWLCKQQNDRLKHFVVPECCFDGSLCLLRSCHLYSSHQSQIAISQNWKNMYSTCIYNTVTPPNICTTDDQKMAAKPIERNNVYRSPNLAERLPQGYNNNPIGHLLFVILTLINTDFYI